jgi:DNA-binding LacI/PurR family transcriptional regulator
MNTPEESKVPVTMQRVADAAGLSRAAVSYALRNHPRIPADTCQRVQALAEAMGYHRNAYVSALMSQLPTRGARSDLAVLGLLVENAQAESMSRISFYREVFAGMDAQALRLGYRVQRLIYGSGALTLKRIRQIVHARGIRGMIVAPLPVGEHRLDFMFQGLACSSIGHSLTDPEIFRVGVNHGQGLTLVWQELRKLGYRRPGLILPEDFIGRTQHGYLGAYLALQLTDPGVTRLPVCILPGATFDAEAIRGWVRTHKPDCVIGAQRELLTLLREVSAVPETVGFVNLALSDQTDVAGLREPDHELGVGAVNQVVAQLHRGEAGVPPSPQTLLMKCRWVPGLTVRARSPQRGFCLTVSAT